ncbi:hypothetical protein P9112_001114 [Eukaryota sp. TZLM1-RC]
MFGGRPHPQDQKLVDNYDYVEQIPTNKEQLRRRVKNLKKHCAKNNKSVASSSDICGFCKEPGHSVKECLHPHCKRSAIPKNNDNKRSRSYRINTINNKNSHPTNVNPSSDHTTDSLNQSFTTSSHFPPKRLLNPMSTSDPESSSINRIFSLSSVCANKSINCPKFIELWLQITNIEVPGLIDSGASISVISIDLSKKCKMQHSSESVKFIGVNGEPSNSYGNAKGLLSFNVSSTAKVVHLTKSLPIVPGNNILIIGIDILYELGLMNNDRVNIHLDELHRTLLLLESEFDHRNSQICDFKMSKTFEEHVN